MGGIQTDGGSLQYLPSRAHCAAGDNYNHYPNAHLNIFGNLQNGLKLFLQIIFKMATGGHIKFLKTTVVCISSHFKSIHKTEICCFEIVFQNDQQVQNLSICVMFDLINLPHLHLFGEMIFFEAHN